jgi:predicted Zn-dependent peptidase
MKVEKMREYFAAKYSPANIVLAFAGKSDWDLIVDLAEAHCGHWTGGETSREAVAPKGTCAFQAILREDDQQQTVIGVCDGPPLESEDRYATQLLTTVIGDHTGSRLYWALVDPGHADGAELSYQDYNQAGAMFTFLSCAPEETTENLARIAEVYREILKDGLTDEELARAKNKVLARSVLRSERPMGRLPSLGFHWTYRREYLSVADELEAFNKVSLADIRKVLDRWPLLPMTVVSVGPTIDVKPPR